MNQIPFLTLGLPVYNGEECIGCTIQSIVDALNNLVDQTKIEILVSDNNSIDKTSEVVKKFIEDGHEIKYYCNETNIGYDGNIDAIVKRANGKYVWFLGCGEKVKIDSLSRLIEKLDNEIEYTNILLDFDIYDERKNIITDKRVFNFENDILLEGKNNFKYTKYGPAVSSNIINKKVWLKVIDKPFVVDGWCHIERILNMIALDSNSRTLFLVNPYFTLYREKDGWWTKPDSYLLLLLLLHIKVIKSMLNMGYDEAIVKKLQYKQSRLALIGAVIQAKSYGLKINKKLFNDLFELFKYDYFFWIFVLPTLILPNKLIFIPKIVLRILHEIKKGLRNVKKTFF
ncbi:glycosyltransferase [Aliarcobacter cryaerophilus]|uniref:glycosyltransferase family 2 protein n=1 Tax=Aliarcobacter cryaerophilus TaxID=28198 RepID=UPI003DA5F3D7